MKLLTYRDGGRTGLAVEGDGGFTGLTEGETGYLGAIDDLLRLDAAALEGVGRALAGGRPVDLARVEVLMPLAKPGKIICVGLNYRDHAAESSMQVPEYPTLFARFASSLIAHGAPLMCPHESDKFDYEGEVVAVIGRGGRRIPQEKALEHVAGYSIFNDGSIRDFQLRTPQWTLGKNFDGTGAFGPVFVIADALPPGARGLRIETRLNGEVVQSASTDDLIFDIAALVSMISVGITLETGDIIVTGTPSGVGAARKPPLFMKAGDLCEIEVEGIGVLANRVADDRSGASSAT